MTCSLGLSDRPAPAHALKNIHSTDLLPPEEDTSWQYHVKAGLRKGTSEMGRISWLVMVSMPASPLTLALALVHHLLQLQLRLLRRLAHRPAAAHHALARP